MNDIDRQLDDFHTERATQVRPIVIDTNRDDDRLRDIVIDISPNTRLTVTPMNLRELGELRRQIVDDLLGGSDRGVLVHAIASKLYDQPFPASAEGAVSQVLDALDAVLSDAERRADR